MTTIGRTVTVKGEVYAGHDLVVEGRIEGPICCEGGAVTIAGSAEIVGNILARDITVFGRCTGQLVATDVVDVRAGATVAGQIITRRFLLDEGAYFSGRAEPQHLDAALSVARFNQKKKEAAAGLC